MTKGMTKGVFRACFGRVWGVFWACLGLVWGVICKGTDLEVLSHICDWKGIIGKLSVNDESEISYRLSCD